MLQDVTGRYKGLQWVTRGYRVYRVLKGVTRGYNGLQEVKGCYRGFKEG